VSQPRSQFALASLRTPVTLRLLETDFGNENYLQSFNQDSQIVSGHNIDDEANVCGESYPDPSTHSDLLRDPVHVCCE
jgi:hypothetical protein